MLLRTLHRGGLSWPQSRSPAVRRWFTSGGDGQQLRIEPGVRAALEEGRPVVALESTIISHGMPYPENLAMARCVWGNTCVIVVRAEAVRRCYRRCLWSSTRGVMLSILYSTILLLRRNMRTEGIHPPGNLRDYVRIFFPLGGRERALYVADLLAPTTISDSEVQQVMQLQDGAGCSQAYATHAWSAKGRSANMELSKMDFPWGTNRRRVITISRSLQLKQTLQLLDFAKRSEHGRWPTKKLRILQLDSSLCTRCRSRARSARDSV